MLGDLGTCMEITYGMNNHKSKVNIKPHYRWGASGERRGTGEGGASLELDFKGLLYNASVIEKESESKQPLLCYRF